MPSSDVLRLQVLELRIDIEAIGRTLPEIASESKAFLYTHESSHHFPKTFERRRLLTIKVELNETPDQKCHLQILHASDPTTTQTTIAVYYPTCHLRRSIAVAILTAGPKSQILNS